MKTETKPPYIVTGSGTRVTFDPVSPDSLLIEDIAHALSQICRFNGHTPLYFSVAQHSLLVSQKTPGTALEKLYALLHDAAEAYVCDIPSPLRPLLGPEHMRLHNLMLEAIYQKFVPGHQAQGAYLHEMYDKAAVIFEAEGFFGFTEEELYNFGYDTSVRELWFPWEPKKFAGLEGDQETGYVAHQFHLAFEDLVEQIAEGT